MEISSSDEPEQNTSLKVKCFNFVGWLGSAAIVTAYAGSFDKITDTILNLGGSIGLFVICCHHKTYQSAFINGLWVVVTIYKFFT